jgi:class 3 adenylate cyclase
MGEVSSLAEKVILESQIRGERTIAKTRFVLIAILAGFAVYVFLESIAQNGLASELRRPDYYVEFACLAVSTALSILILRITSRGGYAPWMRFLPSFVDVSSVAAVHWSISSSINLSYAFTGATVWFYALFIVLSVIRNSAASVVFTGVYSAAVFAAINTVIYSAMGNFSAGGNVYANAAGRLVQIDFDDEIIKAMVILVISGLLAVVSRRFKQMVQKQIELQEISQRYANTLVKINASLERFIPREFLGFLKKENILEVELGDWTECSMSIFFLDIRDFTTLSENMSPQENFRFLNSFLNIFGPIVRTHGGFVDKYPGDGIMALFPDVPDQALESALEMRERLIEYNTGRMNGGYVPIRFGIGIHTGPLMLGTIGENNRMDSTVISDTVNAASRLEGLTKKYSTDILISGDTVRALGSPGSFEVRFVADELVKGKGKAVQVFELVRGAVARESAESAEAGAKA